MTVADSPSLDGDVSEEDPHVSGGGVGGQTANDMNEEDEDEYVEAGDVAPVSYDDEEGDDGQRRIKRRAPRQSTRRTAIVDALAAQPAAGRGTFWAQGRSIATT